MIIKFFSDGRKITFDRSSRFLTNDILTGVKS